MLPRRPQERGTPVEALLSPDDHQAARPAKVVPGAINQREWQ